MLATVRSVEVPKSMAGRSPEDVERYLRLLWISLLLGEYRAVQLVARGIELEEMDVKVYSIPRKVDRELEHEIYKPYGRYVKETQKLLEKRDFEKIFELAREVVDLIGTEDRWARLSAFRPVFRRLDLSTEKAKEIIELGRRLRTVVSERVLRTIATEGYRSETWEKLGVDEKTKELLRELVSTPYVRAAILFALGSQFVAKLAKQLFVYSHPALLRYLPFRINYLIYL